MELPADRTAAKLSIPWIAALRSGMITAAILLVFPRGSPWESLAFTKATILGRAVEGVLAYGPAVAIHLGISAAYGLAICALVYRIPSWRGIVTGGVLGLAAYGLNYTVVRLAAPDLLGAEWAVAFTHFFFGIICAALFKGMARRRPELRTDRGL